MTAQVTFLSGARAGQVETVRKAYIGLGRHPLSDIRFDAAAVLYGGNRESQGKIIYAVPGGAVVDYLQRLTPRR